jgi:hypothetical protein
MRGELWKKGQSRKCCARRGILIRRVCWRLRLRLKKRSSRQFPASCRNSSRSRGAALSSRAVRCARRGARKPFLNCATHPQIMPLDVCWFELARLDTGATRMPGTMLFAEASRNSRPRLAALLESEARRQLQDALVVVDRRPRITGGGNPAKIGRSDVGAGIAKFGVIEKIEGIGANFQL